MSGIHLRKRRSGSAPGLYNEYLGVYTSSRRVNLLESDTCARRCECRGFHFTRNPLVSLPVYLMIVKVCYQRLDESNHTNLPHVLGDANVANILLCESPSGIAPSLFNDY